MGINFLLLLKIFRGQTGFKTKYLFIFFILITVLSNPILAQDVGVLRGFLTDSLSGEALPYGNILIEELNEGTATDNRGYYLIHGIPAPEEYKVYISYIGYKSKEERIKISVDETTVLNLQLVPVNLELQPVEKVDRRFGGDNTSNISIHSYSIDELELKPQGVETDILRSIQNVPGVTGTSDISAKFNVRGGSSNQNLVLLNDAVIYNPFHALGMFSIVDPEMINSFDFYKGGFPTEFAGRVSSVIQLVSKNGNKNRYSGTASASLLTSKASFEGPIPSGSFVITGRKSISNKILKTFYNNKNVPVDFYDFSFNLNYSNDIFWKDARFSVHGFWSGDDINYDNPLKADYLWRNSVYGLSYFQASDRPFFYRLSLTFSNFEGEVDPNLSKIKPKRNEVKDVTYKADFTYVYPTKDILDAGIKLSQIKTYLHLQNSFGDLATTGPYGAAVNMSIYVKYQLLRFNNLGIEVGSRFNGVSLGGGGYEGNPFEPRFRLNYRINSLIKFQASAGVFLQELTTINDEDEVISLFDPWIALPENISATRSTHFTAGIDLTFTENWLNSIEGYYKTTKNLPFLNKEKIFPSDPDLIVGESESYGLEIINILSNTHISLTGSYALAWSFNQIGDLRYRPKYDIRHSLSLSAQVNLGKGWSFSSSWTYRSDVPFKKLLGYYDKFYFNDDPGKSSILDSYSRFMLLENENTGQTPDYHRLDINVLKKIEFSFMKLHLGLSILNVYDRENLFYFDIGSGERVNMLPFLISISVKAEF